MEQHGNNSHNDASDNRDVLYLMGGVALMVLGAGLVMTNPAVRKAVGTGLSAVLPNLQNKIGPDLSTLGPDIERYLKIRSM